MVTGKPAGFAALGIDENDFIDNEEKDFGRSVTWEASTGTSDFRGNPIVQYATGTSKTVVFHVRNVTRIRKGEGFINLAPAYMMHRTTIGIGTGDRVTIGGERWKVFNVVERDGIFIYSDMYREDAV